MPPKHISINQLMQIDFVEVKIYFIIYYLCNQLWISFR